ncbi:MAG: 50S ribosomal protein L18 [Candidatus Diapherotrites archaeon]
MTHKTTYTMPFRRRRGEKTNYKKRLALLKSGKPRLVVRKTNANFLAQIVKFMPKGDETVASANSSELKKFGWNSHKGNLPTAYLVGFACALKAKKKEVKEAVLDIGLYTPVHGSRVFAALKGAVDAGMQIALDEKVFPKEERLKGKHISEKIAQEFEKAKKEIELKIGEAK